MPEPKNTPGLFYHEVTDPQTVEKMKTLRKFALYLDAYILRECPSNRERSIAITHLQTATMFAVASLALTGEKQDPFRRELDFDTRKVLRPEEGHGNVP